MDLSNFDMNLLPSLYALLTERNVTRAGRVAHLSQSAMSGVLARLRVHFKDDLLVSGGHLHQMVLTPLAQSLVMPVGEILEETRKVVTVTTEFDPATSKRRLVLVASEIVIAILLAEVLRKAAEQAPGMSFEIVSIGEYSNDRMETGELDLAILPNGFIQRDLDDRYLKEDLFTEAHSCLVWSGNRMVGNEITKEQYIELGHIVIRPSLRFERTPFRTGPIRAEVVVSGIGSACKLVIGTNRIVTLPTSMAQFFVNSLPLKCVTPMFPLTPVPEMMHWHRQNDGDPANTWFRRLLKMAAADIWPSGADSSAIKKKSPMPADSTVHGVYR